MVDSVAEKQLGGLGLAKTKTKFQVSGPMRLSNRNFLDEFHKIYHKIEDNNSHS